MPDHKRAWGRRDGTRLLGTRSQSGATSGFEVNPCGERGVKESIFAGSSADGQVKSSSYCADL